jgi:hypothetical protein
MDLRVKLALVLILAAGYERLLLKRGFEGLRI